jgi:hypothetical protein
MYAVYCGLWIVCYTVGFPVLLAVFLRRHAEHIKAHHLDVLDPFFIEAGFLWGSATGFCGVPLHPPCYRALCLLTERLPTGALLLGGR